MAEGKKSFILYADQKSIFDSLSDREAGVLIKHIFSYVNDENPVMNSKLLNIAFEPIKQQLKRNLKNWEAERSKRSEAGKKGGIKSGESRRSEAKRRSASKNEANEADNVSVNESVSVNDNVKERENTGSTHNLENSNLYSKPNIPTFEKVHEAFLNAGGDIEMAKKFFDTHESTGWFLKNSPIKKFNSLVPNYVQSWKQNIQNATHQKSNSGSNKLGTSAARIKAAEDF